MVLTRDSAETIGLQVLNWLIGHDTLRPVFLGASGASEDDFRQRVGDPEFLGAVLDFVMMDDSWVVECCDAAGLKYTDLMAARQALPGGGEVHWT